MQYVRHDADYCSAYIFSGFSEFMIDFEYLLEAQHSLGNSCHDSENQTKTLRFPRVYKHCYLKSNTSFAKHEADQDCVLEGLPETI